MPVKKKVIKKHKLKIDISKAKKPTVEDLLPESREFIEEKEVENFEDESLGKLEMNENLNTIEFEKEVFITEEEVEKDEKKKNLIMWIGVTFFMVLIMVVWGYNMKNTIKKTALNNPNNSGDLADITKEFEKTLKEVKTETGSINELKTKLENNQAQNMNTSTLPELPAANAIKSTSTSMAVENGRVLGVKIINDLKSKLEKK